MKTLDIQARICYTDNAAQYTARTFPAEAEALAKKKDIQFIDYIVEKYGLNREDRRELHDDITGMGYTQSQIETIAKDLALLKGRISAPSAHDDDERIG